MTFFRYVLIQVAAYCIDMGVFLALIATQYLGPIAANILGKMAAGLFAFIAHRHYTFPSGSRSPQHRQAIRYGLLLAINIPLSSSALALCLIVIPMEALAKVVADAMCLAITFWASKKFVFAGERTAANCGAK